MDKKLKKFTRQHLDLSTAHVTARDMELLDGVDDGSEGAGVVPCAPYDCGVVIFLLYHEEPELREELLSGFAAAGFSAAFCNLYKLALETDVDMLRLDQDAEVYDALPTFDW